MVFPRVDTFFSFKSPFVHLLNRSDGLICYINPLNKSERLIKIMINAKQNYNHDSGKKNVLLAREDTHKIKFF